MQIQHPRPHTLNDLGSDELDELLKRVEDIDRRYRALAETVGQLYMRADEHGLGDVTWVLDKPMRNASENEQAFAALLDELRMKRHQRP